MKQLSAFILFIHTILLSSASTATKPNVIILLADDLGYTDIGSCEEPIKTPALDELASKGTRFTNNMFQESWIPLIKKGKYTNYRLFDLHKDPNQEHDLSSDMPKMLAKLKSRLLEINASIMNDGSDWHLVNISKKEKRLENHNKLTKEEIQQGWELLFDGEKIENWRRYKSSSEKINGWVVKEGTLHKPPGVRAGNIMTIDTYEDYEFSWDWKLGPKGNNGVKYFIIEERGTPVGHEYQMIDDILVNDPYSSNASFYLVVKPSEDKPNRPMGTWNHSRILVRGNHVEHWLNGRKVLEYECGSAGIMKRIPKTKFRKYPKFGEKVKGHILLTDHSDPCWYRNIKIRTLSPNK